jgi:hypothetical protein
MHYFLIKNQVFLNFFLSGNGDTSRKQSGFNIFAMQNNIYNREKS